MIDFDLYVQSTYSLNGSLIDIDRLVSKASDMGYKTLGLVDQNHMYGAIKFYKKCLEHGIKPIIGIEIFLKTDLYGDLNLLLISTNNTGYKNLIRVSSSIALEGEIDLDELNRFKEGITFVIKSDEGVFSHAIFEDNVELAKNILGYLRENFRTVFIGLDLNNYSIELKVAPKLETLGSMIITNKISYYDKEDLKTSNILSKILRETESSVGLFQSDEVYYNLKTLEELDQIYSVYPQAIKNTLEFIESSNISIDLHSRHLPKYPIKGKTAYSKLVELSKKGLTRRLMQTDNYTKHKEYEERLDYELGIIHKMGYEDYFLIVWDFVLYAKKNLILVGPGRGSAAGSLVAYVLGIVDVDPIEHNLFFERFLNPERITMPDIDMDFPDDKREEVIQYVMNKYGNDKVVSIITFGTFQGKSAIRDVGRILHIDNVILDELSKSLSKANNSIEIFRSKYPKDYSYYVNIPQIKELMDNAEKISGLVKHISTHAAGIIISGEDVREYTPIQKGLLGGYQTQYEASDLEAIGLLKFDFLGLRNLTIISETLQLIKRQNQEEINIYKVPLDDPLTFKLLQEVKTLGVFQLESSGMMDLVEKMQIDNFADISTCISLYRPGPMENIPSYLRRRNSEEKITYPDLDLMPILKPTNGIIIYQEQIMAIAHKFAGYSLGEADVLRRAVSKKKLDILENERKKFVAGSIKNGYSEKVAEAIYDYIVKFANYGFNKSHAVAYGLVAYWMAYLKANYGKYFMSILLDSQIGSVVGTKRYIMECNNMGIKVLPPRINNSGVSYLAEQNDLRFPIKGIKGIGPIAAEKVVAIQQEKEIENLFDFVSRKGDININVIESMIYAGVFDEFAINKRTMIENLPKIINFVDFNYQNVKFSYIEYDEYNYEFLHDKEKELLGINFEYHIIHMYEEEIKKENHYLVSDVIDNDEKDVKFVGVISRVKQIITKNNEEMAFVEIEDIYNSVDSILFPREYERFKPILEVGSVYLFFGKKEIRKNKLQVIIENIRQLKE